MKRGAVIKDNNGRLTTESKEMLMIWAANFKELLNGKGAASCLELPSSVRKEVEVEEIRQEGRIQKGWRMGLIVPIWKRKGMCMTQESTGASHYSAKY